MGEVLSQNEIDALLAALSKGEVSPEAPLGGQSEARSVKKYDFRHPDRFSKDQTRTLEMLHDQFARLLSTRLSTLLRVIVEVRLVSADQLSYSEFIQSIPKPTSINVITMEPLEGDALFELSPSLSFTIIDRLMGGAGHDTHRNRELTDIEKTVVRKILQNALDSLEESWTVVLNLKPRLDVMETNPQVFMQLYMPTEVVILLTFEVTLSGQTGTLSLCIPYVVLEPIARKLSSRSWFSAAKKETDHEMARMIQHRVCGVDLEMVAVLGDTELTVDDLLSLRVGDVVPLDKAIGDSVKIEVGDDVYFTASPGRFRKKKALKIIECLGRPALP